MKKLATLFLVCISFIFLTYKAGAQTCGIDPAIEVIPNYGFAYYKADTTSLLPGWTSYLIDWFVNNSYVSSQDSITTGLGYGYNQVCLRIYATNPSTGDSCIGEHCNIFFSTGTAVFPFLNVLVNGTTVDLNVGYYNNNVLPLGEYYSFEFGDGNTATSPFPTASHTYASPGIYTVMVNAGLQYLNLPSGSGGIYQTITVGGGNNLEAYAQPVLMSCDSIQASASANGPFTSADTYAHLTSNITNVITGTNYNTLGIRKIPGQDYLSTQVNSIGSSDWEHNIYVVQECGIVPDTAYGRVFNDLNFNGIQDPMEAGVVGHLVQVSGSNVFSYIASSPGGEASYYVYTDSLGNFKIPIPHADMRVNVGLSSGQITSGTSNYYTTYDSTIVLYGPYNFGIASLSSEICGLAYLDDNQDSIFTLLIDRALSNVNIYCYNTTYSVGFMTQTDNNGMFCRNVLHGNYAITPVYYMLDSALIYPDTSFGNVSIGMTLSNVNFGFNSPVQTNFEVFITGDFSPRPGFSHNQNIGVFNTGSLNSQGSVVMDYSPVFSSVLQFSPGGIVDTVNKTITWTTDSIAPGQIQHFTAEFSIPSSTPLGTVLNSYAEITPAPGFTDTQPGNNMDSLIQTIVGSFDPNDKISFPSGSGPTGIVMPDTRLTYKIRFQNTGTASAINVFITDTLDLNLDMNTFLMHNSSHAYSIIFDGRVVIWQFMNINLPDSGTNFALSNGFVEFSISPVAGLAEGTIVGNDANIYFDFNEPVTTNEVINTFQTTFIGISEQTYYGNVELFPQPASDACDVVLHDFPYGKGVISLMDLSGRIITEFVVNISSKKFKIPLDLQSVAQGFYLINIKAGPTRVTKQMIKY